MEQIPYKKYFFKEKYRMEGTGQAYLEGEWDREPDKIEWTDKKTGLPCLIVRNRLGALCGYVGVGEKHPFYKVEYHTCSIKNPIKKYLVHFFDRHRHHSVLSRLKGEIAYCDHTPETFMDVHGGLTFSGPCQEDREQGICHSGTDKVWWFGFDCAHGGDLIPSIETLRKNHPGFASMSASIFLTDTYKNISYVKKQVKKLAQQLHQVSAS